MAYKEYFVGEVYFKNEVGNSSNIQVENIAPFIKIAALMWVENILGTYFMNDLLTKYNNGTLSIVEADLIMNIKPIITWRAQADIIGETSVKLSNKGAQKQNSEFSESVEDVTIANKITKAIQRSEFYENYLKKYLTKNKNEFAEFISGLNDDSIIKPTKDEGGNFNNSFMIV